MGQSRDGFCAAGTARQVSLLGGTGSFAPSCNDQTIAGVRLSQAIALKKGLSFVQMEQKMSVAHFGTGILLVMMVFMVRIRATNCAAETSGQSRLRRRQEIDER